jgi:ketosteroid isomerase-like protein
VRGTQRQSPEQVALGGYAAWNSGDVETFLETVHPEVVWVTAGVFPGLRSSYSGHDGMREFWKAFQEPWETLELEIAEIFELDADSVLIGARFHARGRQGIEVDREIANHLRMREGKLWRMRVYPSWEQAIDALGIEDPRAGAGA